MRSPSLSLPLALSAALALLALPRAAAADDAPEAPGAPQIEVEPPPPPPAAAPPAPSPAPAPAPAPSLGAPEAVTESRWYGWQTLIVDGSAIVVGVASQQPIVFLAGYALGGPIVHWAHGNVGTGFVSLGLRVLVPVATTFVGYSIDAASCKPDAWFCGLGGAALGALVGYVGAVTVDSVALAREDVAREQKAALPRLPPVTPFFRTGKEGTVGGLRGTF